jgi:hypothetical protein
MMDVTFFVPSPFSSREMDTDALERFRVRSRGVFDGLDLIRRQLNDGTGLLAGFGTERNDVKATRVNSDGASVLDDGSVDGSCAQHEFHFVTFLKARIGHMVSPLPRGCAEQRSEIIIHYLIEILR